MAKISNIYGSVISRENLYRAAHAAARGKNSKMTVARFNFMLEKEVDRLRRGLREKTYRHGGYGLFTILDPKQRVIAVASFRDRVVHHAVHDIIEPLVDKTLIFDTYACRRTKGTHNAIDRAQSFLRANAYCFHGDIKKYFPSIDHTILKKVIRLKIADQDVLGLFDGIIDSANTITPIRGKGLPIGNLTSQFFANLYLNELDRFVKFDLKQRYYIRYMDDFLVFGNDRGVLLRLRERMKGFLSRNLNLTMHEPKSQVFKTARGIKFLGLRLFAGHRRVASDNARRVRGRLKAKENDMFHGRMETKKFHESLRCWFAYAKNTDSVSLRRNILLSLSKLLRRADHAMVIGLAVLLSMGVSSVARAQYLGGNGQGYSQGRYPPALLSSASQEFFGTASANTLYIRQDSAGSGTGITTSSGINVIIPSGTWDSSITSVTVSGGASAKVSSTVSYANANATLVITVTSNFSDGDMIVVSGLNFRNFTIGDQSLALDTGAGSYDADNGVKTSYPSLGGNGQGHSMYRYDTQQGQLFYGTDF